MRATACGKKLWSADAWLFKQVVTRMEMFWNTKWSCEFTLNCLCAKGFHKAKQYTVLKCYCDDLSMTLYSHLWYFIPFNSSTNKKNKPASLWRSASLCILHVSHSEHAVISVMRLSEVDKRLIYYFLSLCMSSKQTLLKIKTTLLVWSASLRAADKWSLTKGDENKSCVLILLVTHPLWNVQVTSNAHLHSSCF